MGRRAGNVRPDRAFSDRIPAPGIQRDAGADAEAPQRGQPDILQVIESGTVRQMCAALEQHVAVTGSQCEWEQDGLQHEAGSASATALTRGGDIECVVA